MSEYLGRYKIIFCNCIFVFELEKIIRKNIKYKENKIKKLFKLIFLIMKKIFL
jgi:hypothetical protein